jgi:hypothetical protein
VVLRFLANSQSTDSALLALACTSLIVLFLLQFFNDYASAQADPHAFLYPEQNKELLKSSARARKRKRPSPKGAKKYGNRLLTLVHDRIGSPEEIA